MGDTWLIIERQAGPERREVRARKAGEACLTAKGACPGCGAEPFILVQVTEPVIQPDDRTCRAGMRCLKCNDPVGFCYWRPDTIFGLKEDAAVLVHGRCRVY